MAWYSDRPSETWTPRERVLLLALRAEQPPLTFAQIAARLHRTRGAIAGKLHRIKKEVAQ